MKKPVSGNVTIFLYVCLKARVAVHLDLVGSVKNCWQEWDGKASD